jgi:hypothetical protein
VAAAVFPVGAFAPTKGCRWSGKRRESALKCRSAVNGRESDARKSDWSEGCRDKGVAGGRRFYHFSPSMCGRDPIPDGRFLPCRKWRTWAQNWHAATPVASQSTVPDITTPALPPLTTTHCAQPRAERIHTRSTPQTAHCILHCSKYTLCRVLEYKYIFIANLTVLMRMHMHVCVRR